MANRLMFDRLRQQQLNDKIRLGTELTFITTTLALDNSTVEENNPDTTATNVIASDDLELGYFVADDPDCGVRFDGIAIPQFSDVPEIGKTGEIVSVFVQFTQKETTASGTTCVIEIRGINENNTPVFNTTSGDLGSRLETTNTSDWDLTTVAFTAGISNDDSKTTDIKNVVKEILSRAGWVSGNALAIKFKHKAGNAQYRNVASSTHPTYNPPEITIKYKIWE